MIAAAAPSFALPSVGANPEEIGDCIQKHPATENATQDPEVCFSVGEHQLTPTLISVNLEDCPIQIEIIPAPDSSSCMGSGAAGVWLGTYCVGRNYVEPCWQAYGPKRCDNLNGNNDYGLPVLAGEQDNNIRSVFPAGNCWWKLYMDAGFSRHWATCYPYMNGHCPELDPITSSIIMD